MLLPGGAAWIWIVNQYIFMQSQFIDVSRGTASVPLCCCIDAFAQFVIFPSMVYCFDDCIKFLGLSMRRIRLSTRAASLYHSLVWVSRSSGQVWAVALRSASVLHCLVWVSRSSSLVWAIALRSASVPHSLVCGSRAPGQVWAIALRSASVTRSLVRVSIPPASSGL
jgi:hypothetical protein